jgi:hypothetical protein
LRRVVHAPQRDATTGAVVLDEPGRAIPADQVGEVLDLPVLAKVPVKAAIARAVDAGVLSTRLPDALARPAAQLLTRIGVLGGRRGQAA